MLLIVTLLMILLFLSLFQAKYIAQCIEEIKLELRQDNMSVKCNAVAKLTYVSVCFLCFLDFGIRRFLPFLWMKLLFKFIVSASKIAFDRIAKKSQWWLLEFYLLYSEIHPNAENKYQGEREGMSSVNDPLFRVRGMLRWTSQVVILISRELWKTRDKYRRIFVFYVLKYTLRRDVQCPQVVILISRELLSRKTWDKYRRFE